MVLKEFFFVVFNVWDFFFVGIVKGFCLNLSFFVDVVCKRDSVVEFVIKFENNEMK